MRAQFALFRVATAHQHKASGVADTQAFALDTVLARRGLIDEEIHQVVFQQVDLIDVEKATVGLGQQPWLKDLLATGHEPLEVERTQNAIFGGAQGEVHHRHGDAFGARLGFRAARATGAGWAQARGRIRWALVWAAGHHLDGGQHGRQCSHGGGLARAAIAEDEHATNEWVGGCKQQAELHFLLGHHGHEGEGAWGVTLG